MPVVATPRGAADEVVVEGETGLQACPTAQGRLTHSKLAI
jgi:hypothetical protein